MFFFDISSKGSINSVTCWLAGVWLRTVIQGLLLNGISRQALDLSNLFSTGHCGLSPAACSALTWIHSPRLRVSGTPTIPVFGIWHHVQWPWTVCCFNLHTFLLVQAQLPHKQHWIFPEYMSVLPTEFLQYIFKMTFGRLLPCIGNEADKWFPYFLSASYTLDTLCTVQ